MGRAQGRGWLTEEGLQADHTGNEAVKVDAEPAARIPRGDAVLHLVAEHESCRQRGLGHSWSGGLGLLPAAVKVLALRAPGLTLPPPRVSRKV